MSILGAKTIGFFSFISISCIGIFLGLYVIHNKKIIKIIPFANAFASGSLFSLWNFHILPEQTLEISHIQVGFYSGDTFYNVSYFVIYLGFFLMLVSFLLTHEHSHLNGNHHVSTETNQFVSGSKQMDTQHVDRQLESNVQIEFEKSNMIKIESAETRGSTKGNKFSVFLNGLKEFRPVSVNSIPLTFILFGLGLSIHSFFEGFAAGNQESPNTILITTGGLMIHKWIETFLLVVHYPENLKKGLLFWIVIAVATIASPLGLFTDIFLRNASPIVTLIFSSLSTGILLFIVFHILFETVEDDSKNHFSKLLSFLFGSTLVLGLFLISSHFERSK